MGRIREKFRRMELEGRKGLVVYITAGDPDLDSTGEIVLELDRRGVDLV
ncbi:MAG: tryptophan synthase subunit alpha, partial [Candidatus Latescibacterota bacterium]